MMDGSNIGKVIFGLCNSVVPCYPTRAPQKTLVPYLIYNILRVDPDNIKGSIAPVDIVTVLIDFYASSYSDLATRAILVRNMIDNQAGTFSGIEVDRIRYITEQDNSESAIVNGLPVFNRTVEYEFRVKNIGSAGAVLPNSNGNSIIPTPNCTINSDFTFAAAIPPGYTLLSVLTNCTNMTTISIGTNPGGNDVMSEIDCQDEHTQTVDRWFSKTNAQTLYIHSNSWNDNVEFYFLIAKF